ncbi:hypothetical protein [Apibacter sp. HY039]|uniref:hypothetical protein n=1 Tax=Apibacter sp. HY039 TaxID=2501476 RepID=UPI000FEBF88F|nr:hypothetical protein [Apibacter sp. HY039]
MILKIKSANKYLLDILHKNPETDAGLYFKPLKKGIIVGNIVSSYEYEVIFQDTKYSYLPEDSNQIDFQSYCNPLVILHISNELFNHILKEKSEYVQKEISWLGITQGEADTQECTIEIPSFFIHSNWYRDEEFLLSKYFEGIKLTQVQGKVFNLKIKGKSIFEAINLLNLVALLAHITNDYGLFTFIDDQFAQKYARILTNIDHVPYFVFYLFIKRATKSEKQFKNIKPVFEEYLRKYGMEAELSWLGTHADRVRFITDKLELDRPIVDIGCGEFIYYKKMMNKGFRSHYIAVDENENFASMAEYLPQRYQAENLEFYTRLEQVRTDECVNVIMTEVIEHNTLEEAKKLIKQALQFNINKMIITTPNSDFNVYYSESLDKRHEDHDFELSEKEFKELIEECASSIPGIITKYSGIGDSINGIQPTQAVIIQKQ